MAHLSREGNSPKLYFLSESRWVELNTSECNISVSINGGRIFHVKAFWVGLACLEKRQHLHMPRTLLLCFSKRKTSLLQEREKRRKMEHETIVPLNFSCSFCMLILAKGRQSVFLFVLEVYFSWKICLKHPQKI